MSSQLPSSSIQEAVIDVTFNAQLLGNLLMGVYTVIYLGTLYIYTTKKSDKNWLVIASISLSYLAYVTTVSVQWYLNKQVFVDSGSSRETVFVAVSGGPVWATFVNDICDFVLAIAADGLLIWRCFNVWGSTFRIIFLPSFLLFSEIALDISVIVITLAKNFRLTEREEYIVNKLIGTSLYVTAATTGVTTIFISYRVYCASKQNLLRGSKARIEHILEILIQSAAVYCIFAVAAAVISAVPVTNSNSTQLFAAEAGVFGFYAFTAGVAPTVMVARVAIASDTNGDPVGVTDLSGLRFQHTERIPGLESTEMDDGSPKVDVKEIEDKLSIV